MSERNSPENATRKSVPPPASETATGQQTGGGWGLEPASLARQFGKIGRFQVRRLLGEGAFARVYLGFDPQLEREVAIKVPKLDEATPEFREAFVRENRLAAIIQHPNVCPIYDVGSDGGLPYIVMRFVSSTLAAQLGKLSAPLPARTAVAIARKLALGLTAAHAQKVVHRDLKPANVLWDETNRDVFIADFGLARLVDGASEASNGVPKGTPAYMAPEQARGQAASVGPLSDLYSLGVILYEMLTGRVPFTGSVWEVMRDHCETQPAPPSKVRPSLDPRVDALCLKAMAKHPADRYASAKAFADALTGYLRATELAGSAELPVAEIAPEAKPAKPAADSVRVLPEEPKPVTARVVVARPAAEKPEPRKIVAAEVEEDEPKGGKSARPRKRRRKEATGGSRMKLWAVVAGALFVGGVFAVGIAIGVGKSKKPAETASAPDDKGPAVKPAEPPPPPPKKEPEVKPKEPDPKPPEKDANPFDSVAKLDRLGTPGAWVAYKCDGFTAEFPGTPEERDEAAQGVNLKITGVVAKDRGTLMVMRFQVASDVTPAGFEKFVKSVSETPAFKGHPVVDVTVDDHPAKEIDCSTLVVPAKMRFVAVKNRVYGWTATAGTADGKPTLTVAEVDRLLNSVRIAEPSAAAPRPLTAAERQAQATADYKRGSNYNSGTGGAARDQAKARAWYERAAEQGHADAQLNLGYLHGNGLGGPVDHAKAKAWYEKAAAQGNAQARCNLGVLYATGRGVTRDYAKAKEWYELAATQGNAAAQNNLGVLYFEGSGVTRDYAKAKAWYEKAAAQGNDHAQHNLGTMYEKGYGVSKDLTRALGWYRKAAAQGYEPSKKAVERLEKK